MISCQYSIINRAAILGTNILFVWHISPVNHFESAIASRLLNKVASKCINMEQISGPCCTKLF